MSERRREKGENFWGWKIGGKGDEEVDGGKLGAGKKMSKKKGRVF